MGLRYFNVFGPRQDPGRRLRGGHPEVDRRHARAATPVYINGTGETSRDFCYVRERRAGEPARAPPRDDEDAVNEVYNVAVGRRTTLLELFVLLRSALLRRDATLAIAPPVHREFRAGDVRTRSPTSRRRPSCSATSRRTPCAGTRRVARLVRAKSVKKTSICIAAYCGAAAGFEERNA